ncbi:hypothetical protein YYC_02105 [Plasmodium yoelii 17X]|uniref:PIR protein n=3 Tax=Plasmodium yoelii TaxID=5861 RepID=A0AAE9WYL0_PLAYO|nr:PIR protein [Plasmodium yoelii]ETB61179.1 hypothetical protein YYC_02105 [Plasmodium yoelii 17X]WBY58939.1 PIR protein [Plasmodium yoelii yoelii]CDS44931.1 YIR protein [Plasmodium yoelii]VTZ79771.1 PIR protein [Plasmodium yoelii]|eukprot:XP_022812526.1 PIR protein [Plasmodium yoelii]
MNKQMCKILISTSNSFSNNLDKDRKYQFNMNEGIFSNYCTSNNCSTNHEKINAGCLYLLDAFFKDSKLFETVAKSNINVVEYIMIWLSKILKLIEPSENESLKFFYDIYIQNDGRYKNTINTIEGCNNYKDLIDKKKMKDMKIKDISKLYDAFYSLCMMYIEFDEENPKCNKYLTDANNFVEKYKKLKADSSIIEKSSYIQLLSTLLTDYNNFINKYSVNCPNSSFPTIEKAEKFVGSIEQISEVASSNSSIGNKLFIVLSIFGAIAFFLGISYKYSLFGFRKRFQKQKLREKLKNIKKRMNH